MKIAIYALALTAVVIGSTFSASAMVNKPKFDYFAEQARNGN
jgi:hypothetical protein